MATKRLNVTIEETTHELIKAAADELYSGNVSRYLADAGPFYAGVLRGRKPSTQIESSCEESKKLI